MGRKESNQTKLLHIPKTWNILLVVVVARTRLVNRKSAAFEDTNSEMAKVM